MKLTNVALVSNTDSGITKLLKSILYKSDKEDPIAVQITIIHSEPDHYHGSPTHAIHAQVTDVSNNEILYAADLKLVHDWLINREYSYVLGTNHVWRKQ
jgi:hypothetical protein